ncbi:Periplasmic pH-dependent serine endoprotease DegQ precursor [Symmachiella macrocystis]|uniref:Periplasmic pH-dependent serine endoprotease DegQ n=1 Tax=Symmachiella macrocystis TaxID=2527985 RepID=A0A5C6BJF7_9PLAN|nr:PDZ domain-containing protein [Symmachiella macrocystis]TWU11681.1 Periplasmic pH-dependent serine endoprotease DegQ precursor [Symmachiella macrocystis]
MEHDLHNSPVRPHTPRGRLSSRGRRVVNTASVIAITLIASLCLFSPTATAQDVDSSVLLRALEQSLVKAVEVSEESVVSIAREKIENIRRANQRQFDRIQRGRFQNDKSVDMNHPDYIPNDFGSGVVLGEITVNGARRTAILTNYHVVKGAETSTPDSPVVTVLSVRFQGKQRGMQAQIWAADPRSDLAIITIEALGLQPIKIAKSHTFKKGQFVLALGNPLAVANDGGSASVSWGIISNISRRANSEVANPDGTVPDPQGVGNERLYHFGRLLQIDAKLNLGMSGGALLNINGELIGITTSLAALAGYEKSAGYAIPVDDTTQRVIETLLKGQEVEYGFLGVSFKSPEQRDYLRNSKLKGARISSVLPNLPASDSGLMENDFITEIDGKQIRNRIDLMREIGQRAPGTNVRLQIYRNSRNAEYKNVVLGKWPAKNVDEIIAPIDRYGGAWRGLVVDFSSGRSQFFPGPTQTIPRGVLVTEVVRDSPAERAQFKRGDFITKIDDDDVQTPQEFHRLVARHPAAVRLLRLRDKESQQIVIEPH